MLQSVKCLDTKLGNLTLKILYTAAAYYGGAY